MAGTRSWVQHVLQARVLVAALGEAARPAWWRSEATDTIGQRMLKHLYPRTYVAASLQTACRAAAIQHDAHLDGIGAYHLFRLPVGDETALHEYLLSEAGHKQIEALFSEQSRAPALDAQIEALLDIARLERPVLVRGPVAVGSIAELRSGRALRRMCGAYAAGFSEQKPVYPYLVKAVAP